MDTLNKRRSMLSREIKKMFHVNSRLIMTHQTKVSCGWEQLDSIPYKPDASLWLKMRLKWRWRSFEINQAAGIQYL